MSRTVIGIYEVREAAKKKQFADLFPEHRVLFDAYWRKPGCGDCWRSLLRAVAPEIDRIRTFFGDVEVDLGEAPPPRKDKLVAATTVVLGCKVGELQQHIDRLCAQNTGMKTFAVARWKDEVTVVVSVVDVEARDQGHVVLNTSVTLLSEALDELDRDRSGPKQFAISRYEDEVTVVITILA